MTAKSISCIKEKNTEIKIIGGDYKSTLAHLDENIDYLIVLYDKLSYNIDVFLHIQHEDVNEENIIPRKPLSLNAKRAGWQGCYLHFNRYRVKHLDREQQIRSVEFKYYYYFKVIFRLMWIIMMGFFVYYYKY